MWPCDHLSFRAKFHEKFHGRIFWRVSEIVTGYRYGSMYIQRTRNFGRACFFRICWCTRSLLCLPIVLLDQSPKFWENEVAKYGCSWKWQPKCPNYLTWSRDKSRFNKWAWEFVQTLLNMHCKKQKNISRKTTNCAVDYFSSCNLVLLPQITYPSFLLGACSCLVEPFYPMYLYLMVFGKECLTLISVNAVTIFKVNEGIHSIHVVHKSRGVRTVT